MFFKQKTAYEIRISDWGSDVCSSDLFDGLRNHWRGELHALQQDVLADVAQGFACSDVFQADHSGDVACQNFLDFSTVVGVHLQDTADTFFLALDRVVDRFTGMQHARVNAHEGQLTHERDRKSTRLNSSH